MATDFVHIPKAFNVRINVRKNNMGGNIIESLQWFNSTPMHHIRWMWYYKYRAALFQVKYPKHYIEFEQWKTIPQEKTNDQLEIHSLKNNIKTCRRMVTKCTNGINGFIEEQKEMLIKDWDNPYYLKVLEKRDKYQKDLDNHLKKLKTYGIHR